MTPKKDIIERWAQSPKRLLLFDAAGALLSVILLGFVLPMFESTLGIPKDALFFLASLPVLFILVDVVGMTRRAERLSFWLRFIAVCNLLYCVISLSVFLQNRHSISALGWGYATVEIALIVLIGVFEILCARKMEEAPPHC